MLRATLGGWTVTKMGVIDAEAEESIAAVFLIKGEPPGFAGAQPRLRALNYFVMVKTTEAGTLTPFPVAVAVYPVVPFSVTA